MVCSLTTLRRTNLWTSERGKDYESLLIFEEHAPMTNVPSIKSQSLLLFLKYKYLGVPSNRNDPKSAKLPTLLLDSSKNPVVDVFGNQIFTDLCFTDNFNPKSVVVCVWGKTDEKFENVKFWRDEAIPEFCPIIYFMVQSKKKTKLS